MSKEDLFIGVYLQNRYLDCLDSVYIENLQKIIEYTTEKNIPSIFLQQVLVNSKVNGLNYDYDKFGGVNGFRLDNDCLLPSSLCVPYFVYHKIHPFWSANNPRVGETYLIDGNDSLENSQLKYIIQTIVNNYNIKNIYFLQSKDAYLIQMYEYLSGMFPKLNFFEFWEFGEGVKIKVGGLKTISFEEDYKKD